MTGLQEHRLMELTERLSIQNRITHLESDVEQCQKQEALSQVGVVGKGGVLG